MKTFHKSPLPIQFDTAKIISTNRSVVITMTTNIEGIH